MFRHPAAMVGQDDARAAGAVAAIGAIPAIAEVVSGHTLGAVEAAAPSPLSGPLPVLTVDQAGQADAFEDRVRHRTPGFFTRDMPPRSPAALDHELQAARQRRQQPQRS